MQSIGDDNYLLSKQELLNVKFANDFRKAGVYTCISPFKYNKNFKDKKFYRYVAKIDKMLIEQLSVTSSTKDDKTNIYNLGICNCLYAISDELGFEDEEESNMYDILGLHKEVDLSNIFSMDTFFNDSNTTKIWAYIKDHIFKVFLDTTEYPNDMVSISKIVFEDTIIRFLTEQAIIDNFDETNYMLHMPTLLQLHTIFFNFQTKLYNELSFWIIKQALNEYDIVNEGGFTDIQKKIDIVLAENTQLKDQIKQEKEKNKNYYPTILKCKKEAEMGTKAQQEMFNDAITEKDREIRRLEKQIENLKNKLSTVSTEEVQEIIEEELPTLECDTSLKYVFVIIKNNDNIEYQLRSIFPNAIFISNYDDLLPMDTPLVIYMTAKLKHDLYYKIKNKCKANNIKSIHFGATNIELLKTEIAKKLNNN